MATKAKGKSTKKKKSTTGNGMTANIKKNATLNTLSAKVNTAAKNTTAFSKGTPTSTGKQTNAATASTTLDKLIGIARQFGIQVDPKSPMVAAAKNGNVQAFGILNNGITAELEKRLPSNLKVTKTSTGQFSGITTKEAATSKQAKPATPATPTNNTSNFLASAVNKAAQKNASLVNMRKSQNSTGKLPSTNPTPKPETKSKTTTDPSQQQLRKPAPATPNVLEKAKAAVNQKYTTPATPAKTTTPANAATPKLTVIQPEGEWKSMGNAGGRPVATPATPAKTATPANPATPAKAATPTPTVPTAPAETSAQAAKKIMEDDAAKAATAEEKAAIEAEAKAAKIEADPYKYYGLQDEDSIAKYYTDMANKYTTSQQEVAGQQIKGRNAAYDKQQNENYINYMLAQKALPEQLARMGLSGGASETSQLRANMNYANQRGATDTARNAEIAGINQDVANRIAAYRQAQDAAARQEIVNNASELYNRRNADAQTDWEREWAREQLADARAQANNTNYVSALQHDADQAEGARQFNETQSEGIRQFNEEQKEKARQFDATNQENARQFDASQTENARQFNATHEEGIRQFNESNDLENRKFAEDQKQNEITNQLNEREVAEKERSNKANEELEREKLELDKQTQAIAQKNDATSMAFSQAQTTAAMYGTVKACEKMISKINKKTNPSQFDKFLKSLLLARKYEIQGEKAKANLELKNSIKLYNKTH